LGTLLTLPLITALIPGRDSFDFREQTAWLDSMRVLAIPLLDGFRMFHFLLATAALSTLASLWQEVLPALRRPRPDYDDAPEGLTGRARALPEWERCRVGITPSDEILLATAGRPSRPRLIVSRGALSRLSEEELEAVFLHENAHWRRDRWLLTHLFFLLRIVQFYNPVALWAFREYAIQVEIDCDADAASGRDPKLLARALLKVYESTNPRDFSSRNTLRKRVDTLLGRAEPGETKLPAGTLLAAALTLLLVLPWIV
jgi:Zn-dependent protease with chaperone function